MIYKVYEYDCDTDELEFLISYPTMTEAKEFAYSISRRTLFEYQIYCRHDTLPFEEVYMCRYYNGTEEW